MNVIREQSKNPLVVALVGFIVGAIFGLIVLGWWIWPVEWIDATPAELSFEWQVEYTRMAIEAYGQNGNTAAAQERFAALGEDAGDALAAVAQDPQGIPLELVADFSNVVVAAPGLTPEAPVEEEKTSALPILLAALCILLLVALAFLAYMLFFKKRLAKAEEPAPVAHAPQVQPQAGNTDYAAAGTEPPIGQFMASYKIGDDLFDDSFSIDSASGEFLGECGVGISETIGVGDHKKVTAFEVWLFDKNDIQTVTKVLMSAHAFNDSAVRQRLEAKGEPVLVEPGIETVLETQTLQLVARVADTSYGDSAMPEESYFNHLLLELVVWVK
jgi:hypothetical protein